MKYIDLSGRWTLEIAEHSIPIQLPGDSYSALIGSGIMPDPYYADNELNSRWPEYESCTIHRSIDIDPDETGELYFESLDCIADVYINDSFVGRNTNMFHPFRVQIAEQLKKGRNTISITFPAYHDALQTGSYEIPMVIFPVQFPHRNLLRKVQCHAGWDWGPCLMVHGIYGRMHIASSPWGCIHHLHCDIEKSSEQKTEQPAEHRTDGGSNSCWTVNLCIEYEGYQKSSAECSFSLEGGTVLLQQYDIEPGMNKIQQQLHIEDPQLWWPRGYGEQALYTLRVQIHDSVQEKQIGFRSLEWIAEDDADGRSLFLRINGRNIFAKGANWIPTDALPSRQTVANYERLLQDASAANMNILRVWGGGQYEADIFYELCDKMGILIWQDFMFSCALYPADDEFLQSVRREAEYQIKRLKDHPSLALWCGNNENLAALNWFEISRNNRDRYLVDYDRLNNGILRQSVASMDSGRMFWGSSPSDGSDDYNMKWYDDSRGDMHYWSVFHERKAFTSYRDVIPRFCSEFGFQSFPSPDIIASYCPPEEQNLTTAIMDHHQRHPAGNAIIIEQLARYFRFPVSTEHALYLSQIQQAMAIATAIEYWRCMRPRCMGIMYWQLNELWPGCSWASIEYNGTWKPLHYLVKRYYEDTQIFSMVHKETLQSYISHDGYNACTGSIELRHIAFDGSIIWEEDQEIEILPACATLVQQREDYEPDRGFIHGILHFEDPKLGTREIRECWNLLAFPKYCKLEKPTITVEIEQKTERTVDITLQTTMPAFYVLLYFPGLAGNFDDNLLILLPHKKKTISFYARRAISAAELRETLVIHDLYSLCYDESSLSGF